VRRRGLREGYKEGKPLGGDIRRELASRRLLEGGDKERGRGF